MILSWSEPNATGLSTAAIANVELRANPTIPEYATGPFGLGAFGFGVTVHGEGSTPTVSITGYYCDTLEAAQTRAEQCLAALKAAVDVLATHPARTASGAVDRGTQEPGQPAPDAKLRAQTIDELEAAERAEDHRSDAEADAALVTALDGGAADRVEDERHDNARLDGDPDRDNELPL